MAQKKSEDTINIGWILRTLLITLGVLIIGAAVFFAFRIRTNARLALREAKNIYISLSTTEIEYYAQEKSIYDPTKIDGLSDGVKERVRSIMDPEGTYSLASFDTTKHRIRVMHYRKGNYYITYSGDGDVNNWEVNYLMPILWLSGTDQ